MVSCAKNVFFHPCKYLMFTSSSAKVQLVLDGFFGLTFIQFLLEKAECFDVLSRSPDHMKVVFQVATSQNKVYLSADSLVLIYRTTPLTSKN